MLSEVSRIKETMCSCSAVGEGLSGLSSIVPLPLLVDLLHLFKRSDIQCNKYALRIAKPAAQLAVGHLGILHSDTHSSKVSVTGWAVVVWQFVQALRSCNGK